MTERSPDRYRLRHDADNPSVRQFVEDTVGGQAADLVLAQSTAVFLSSVSTLSASAMADRTSTPNVFLVTSIRTGKGKATLLTLSIAYLCILSERLGSFHSMHAALSQQINSPLSVPDPLRHSHHLKLPSSFGCSSFTFFFRVCISSERRTTPTPVKWFRKLLLRNSLASSSVNLAERSSKKK